MTFNRRIQNGAGIESTELLRMASAGVTAAGDVCYT